MSWTIAFDVVAWAVVLVSMFLLGSLAADLDKEKFTRVENSAFGCATAAPLLLAALWIGLN
jgi:hypothetical protein